ncbi:MAG: cell division protein FtsZ, partial [Rhodothermales bacterium]
LLKENVDTLIIIPNERLLDMADVNTTLMDAFSKADEVLYNATRGISDLITVHGLINLDFADVRTTMKEGGTALMGAAMASGDGRAEKAAQEALASPLLDGLSIHGARNVLVNITAGKSLGIREATAATSIIQREAGEDVEVIFGTVIDEEMGDELRITVIATGFDTPARSTTQIGGRHLTLPLDEAGPVIQYKGEEALQKLDMPAYQRRTASLSVESPAKTEGDGAPSRVRRLQAEDIEKRVAHVPSEKEDMPAFLRKMLD